MTRAPNRGITVRILTRGCAKNSVDSEVMAGLLADAGYRVVPGGRADVGVVNTCGFIRDAKEESLAGILALAREKAAGRIRHLVVAGCLAGRYRDDLPAALPEVDLFLGPGDIPALPDRIGKMLSGSAERSSAGGPAALPDRAYRRRARDNAGPSAYLKVLEGCDHRCAYCTIPSIRGPLVSRDAGSLLAEARSLVRGGAREINLVGQDIASFGADRGGTARLAPLVRRICAIPGVRWVRLLYLYPTGIDDALVDLLATEPKVCRYLDIPVQHADADVLRRMGRRYGPGDVTALVARLRARVPGIFLRTSVIVGFPGETARAFDRLLRFIHEVRWDYLGVFPYSREEGTPAYAMRPQVPGAVKRERARKVQDAQADILAARNAAMAGREIDVLVEEVPARGPARGRHAGQAPEVDGNVLLSGYRGPAGRFVRARVTGAREWDLFAKPVDTGSGPGILT
ncbi:MAG: 30S ribosomal protein S12 methylthiotransferase RimO [Gemmatimonadota bacterium]